MTDRSVSVYLRANVTGYLAAVEKAKLATRDFARDTAKSATTHRQAWDQVGKGMLLTGGVVAAGLALAVKASMAFQAQMAQVKSLSGATAGEMAKLADAAKTTGQKFGISAKEAADAETELVKAGISVTDILGGGLQGALTLAADGQMNVADATSIAASAMVQFGLKGKDIPHIADLLASGADKALGSVGDLGQALTSSGTVAAQWGLTMEQTVGTLAEFAAAGQTGERGGTLLRQMLLQLTTASGPAKALMDQYGFSVRTAGGGLADTATIAGRLQQSFGGLDAATRTHALGVIFGAHAIQGANILMKDGAAVNADWAAKVNDSGFAAKQAAGKMDSLSGDLTKLKAAFQTGLIDTGDQATGTLRGMTKAVTGAVTAYDNLGAGSKSLIVGLGGVVAVTTLVGGAALIAVPKVVALRNALAELNATSAGGKLGAFGKVAGPIGAVATGLAIGKSSIDASVASRVQGRTSALSDPAAMAAARSRLAGLSSQLQQLQGAQSSLPGAASAQRGVASNTNLARVAGQYAELKKEIDAASAAYGTNSSAATAQAAATKAAGGAAAQAADDTAAFKASLDALSHRFDVKAQTDALTEGFHKLGEQAKTAGTAVHGNSDAALANRDALRQNYQTALGIIQAYKDQGHTAEEVRAKTKQVTDQFVTQAGKAGFVKSKVQDYVDALHAVPSNVNTHLTVSGLTTADRQLGVLQGKLNKLHAGINAPGGFTGGLFTGTGFLRRSAGGPVWGAGTATSDSVPALLSRGEFVINAASAAAIGSSTLHALNRYARGGGVATMAPGAQAALGSITQTNQFYGVTDPDRAANLSLARLAWARR